MRARRDRYREDRKIGNSGIEVEEREKTEEERYERNTKRREDR